MEMNELSNKFLAVWTPVDIITEKDKPISIGLEVYLVEEAHKRCVTSMYVTDNACPFHGDEVDMILGQFGQKFFGSLSVWKVEIGQ